MSNSCRQNDLSQRSLISDAVLAAVVHDNDSRRVSVSPPPPLCVPVRPWSAQAAFSTLTTPSHGGEDIMRDRVGSEQGCCTALGSRCMRLCPDPRALLMLFYGGLMSELSVTF